MRAREMVRPRHAREAANAPPALLDLLMRELRAAGAALGVPGSLAGEGYDPDVYAAIYMRLLERRHVEVLPIEECLPAAASPYELGVGVAELRPAPAEVGSAMAQVEALGERGLQETVQSWFRSAAMGAPPARD